MNQEAQIVPSNKVRNFFDEAPYYILLALAFLLPIIVRFGGLIPTEYFKSGILFVGTTLALLLFSMSLLTKRAIHFLKHPLVWSASVVLVAGMLSSFFSGALAKSFFGNGFEIGTFFGLLSLVLVFIFSAMYSRKESRIFSFLLALSISTSIASLLTILRSFTSFSFLGLENSSMTTAGLWTGSAFLFGTMSLVQAITLELSPLAGRSKKIITTGFVLSLIGFIVSDFALAWWIVGVIALVYIAYRIFFLKDAGTPRVFIKNKFVSPSAFIIIFALIFVIFGGDGSGLDRLTSKVLPSSLDARPTWPTTMIVMQETWKSDPVFGVGPNRFGTELSKYKAPDINGTPFWGVDFNSAVGYIPTFLVTGGIVGAIAWVLFLGALLWYAIKNIFNRNIDPAKRGINTAIVFGSFLTWTVLFSFVPGAVMTFLAFLFGGLFTALLVGEGDSRVVTKSTDTKTVFGFVAMALVVLVALSSLTLGYVYMQKGRAMAYSAESSALIEKGEFAEASSLLTKAVNIYNYDTYLRALAEARVADLTLRINGGLSPAEIQETFTREFPEILSFAERAVAFDESDYLNWVSLGTTYQMALSLGISNAYDRALAAFEQAIRLNPNGPGVYLGVARLELARNNFDGAKARLDQALSLKPDYIDALYLHSQIAVRTGKTEEAIERAINAAAFSPNNVGLLFQLGLLYYTNTNYAEAVTVLERTVALQNDFSNGHYYLGLAYNKLGKKDEAKREFEKLLSLNPESSLAQGIIANITAGKDPLYGIELSGSGTVQDIE